MWFSGKSNVRSTSERVFCTGRSPGGAEIRFAWRSTSIEIRWWTRGPIVGPYNSCVRTRLRVWGPEIGLSIWFQSPCARPKTPEITKRTKSKRKQHDWTKKQTLVLSPGCLRFSLDIDNFRVVWQQKPLSEWNNTSRCTNGFCVIRCVSERD